MADQLYNISKNCGRYASAKGNVDDVGNTRGKSFRFLAGEWICYPDV
jgi:hypothetical protein